MPKTIFGNIQKYVQSFDIICIGESKLDGADEHNVEDVFKEFSAKFQHRTKYTRKSGGLLTLVKNHIAKHVSEIDDPRLCDIDWIQPFKVHKELTGQDFILCNTYVPPDNSKYMQGDEFETLAEILCDINVNSNLPICIMGDLNARTGHLEDFTLLDDHVAEVAGLPERNDIFVNAESIESLGIKLKRCNEDDKINTNGNKFLDMCKDVGVLIANGRIGKDSNIGKLTCSDSQGNLCSAVDYAAISPILLNTICDFEIDTFDNTMSDKHCPINCRVV